jgi:NTE family protein
MYYVFAIIVLLNVIVLPQNDTIEFSYISRSLPFGLKETVPSNIPDIAIALSGGGSRGIAQIGVLKAFEEKGITFNRIIGTSMGSVVGGLYAAGYSLDQIDSIFKATDWEDLLIPDRESNRRDLFVDQKITEDKAIVNLRLKGLNPILPTSINDGQKLSNYLNLLVLNAPIHLSENFDELRFSYRSVCTDLKTGNPVVIGSGSLSQAMRASSSVSFLLSPVKVDSLILVDGGLVANIPVRIASGLSEYVIAVNTTSELHNEEELTYPWFVADQIVSIPMKLLNESQLNDADAIISPLLGSKASTDFTNIDSLVLAGYNAGVKSADRIKKDIDSLFISKLNKPLIYYKNIRRGTDIPLEAEFYLQKYMASDSVSNFEIYSDLFRLHQTGRFKSIKALLRNDSAFTTISYSAEYNPLIKNVIVSRNPEAAGLKTKEHLHALSGLYFNASAVSEYLVSTLKQIRETGYSLADIEKASFDEESGILYVNFNEGIIDSISIIGNTYTNPGVIEREFRFKEGDHFKLDKIEEWLTNLRSTNLFDDINLTVHREEEKNILILRVLEKNSSVMRLGFRIDNENKFQAALDVRDENLFGTGTELGFLISLGSRNRNYVLEHKSNRLFNTYFTYKIKGYYQVDDAYSYLTDPETSPEEFTRSIAGEYRQIYYGTSLSLGSQVGRFGNFIFTGKYQFDEVKNKTGNTVSPYKIKVVSLRISSIIDTQDKYPYPDNGMYFYGWYETAQSALGGDVGFTNVSFEYKYHFNFVESHTVIPKIQMGFGDNTLPLSEQYSLGGQNSFLGMREDEYRGRQIFLSSIEYRYKLPFLIFFDSFFRIRYDLGSTWDMPAQIKFKDLKHGVGATLSLDTPVGPADFSAGRSFLFKQGEGGTTVSRGELFLYFSIGYYY